jgi:hypothetical protein
MPTPKLTIGFAVYDDFDGVYFTVQALRLYHAEAVRACELVVVDNHPSSEAGRTVQQFLGWVKGDFQAVRYLPAGDVIGTSAPRQRVFDEATAEAVLCIDPHVLLPAGGLDRLLAYYAAHPDTRDLLSGPMLYDDLFNFSTHFADEWRGQMWGTWGTDARAFYPDGRPGLNLDAAPFEIPACGLGLFTCRKEAWLGFNPLFRGFGAEEFYIHTKFRQAGARCLCLPFLRWLHRFGRPAGVPYPLTVWNKVRNYVIGHRELGLDLAPIHNHFAGLMPEHEWRLLADNDPPPELPEVRGQRSEVGSQESGCGVCAAGPVDLEAWYTQAAAQPSDINEHAATLRDLASQCAHVTAFGGRHGVSTVALLAGRPGRLAVYDRQPPSEGAALSALAGATVLSFHVGDWLENDIEETDLLFIDTKHTADQLEAELVRHAPRVRHWLVLHDTQIFGETGEDGGPGLLVGLRRYLRSHPEWTVIRHDSNNHGLTVLSCDPRDKQALPGKIKQAANFAAAIAKHAAGGFGNTDPETFNGRLEICALCPLRNEEKCGVCGCPIENKAAWAEQECPVGKWPVENKGN